MKKNFTITLPLPGDVDLSQMDFMPTYDERLMKSRSWLRAKNWRDPPDVKGPGLGFVIFNLWAYVFRVVPAGSIENNDDVLAEAARCGIEYWLSIKSAALTGWQLIDGNWHHPVVCEIAWGVWMDRLDARHENARRTWAMTAKRKHDQGLAVPDAPPTDFRTWLRQEYPETAAYIDAQSADASVCASPCDANVSTCTSACVSDVRPKRSEDKGESPPDSPPKAERAGKRRTIGQDWFAGEEARLRAELGAMANPLQSLLQQRGVSARYSFVRALKGAWLDPEGPAIVLPSVKAAANLRAAIGAGVAATWPKLQIRHGRVDELRARKALEAA